MRPAAREDAFARGEASGQCVVLGGPANEVVLHEGGGAGLRERPVHRVAEAVREAMTFHLAVVVDAALPAPGPGVGFGDGDGTVPHQSAGMGEAALSAVHYVCGVEHSKLTGHKKVTSIVKDFLLDGDPIEGEPGPCPTR